MAYGYEASVKVFVLGGNGFVGSAYSRLLQRLQVSHVVIHRGNYADYVGKPCNVLINANGNSRKLMAGRDPKGDFRASVDSVVASLEDFPAEKYVFLSTGDVYPDQSRPEVTREVQVLDTRAMSRYGLHKFIAEELVRAVHPNWLVMRMGGFVGPGMKKNCVYDILNGPQIWLHPDSELQFIHTDSAAEIVWRLVERGVSHRTLNLGSQGVARVGDIYSRVGSAVPYAATAAYVRFELNLDRLAELVGDLPHTSDEINLFIKGCGRARLNALGLDGSCSG